MGKIYLIRHGETDANQTFQFQGHIDNPLNSKGFKQTADLGKYYEGLELDEIYSSSMQRARQLTLWQNSTVSRSSRWTN